MHILITVKQECILNDMTCFHNLSVCEVINLKDVLTASGTDKVGIW